jgi:hypothetical protein
MMCRLDARTREFKEQGEFSDLHEPFLVFAARDEVGTYLMMRSPSVRANGT